MKTLNNSRKIVRGILVQLAVTAGIAGLATPASAYVLYKTTSCNPGLKWDSSHPVTVRLLADSYFDYLDTRDGQSSLADLTRIVGDIEAVIGLYNSIPGSSLVLELGTGVTGHRNLDDPETDNFGRQTIVIGFTNGRAEGSASAEAWATGDPNDGCTRTRAHISFRKDFNWIFGPPDTTEVDGRAFYTADQRKRGSSKPRTFLGILTHEMGHAIGLGHPDDDYGVMAQSFRTWFRGENGILRTRLLPDDTAGVLALYGRTGAPKPLDISVSNTWYKSAEAQFNSCTAEIARVDAAARAVSQATGLPVDREFPAEMIFKGEYADLFEALANAQDALRACEDSKNAMQIRYCKVSSRGDDWVGRLTLSPLPFCGVNSKTGSVYAPVSDRVCPGEQIQLRYTLNNHTSLRDALVKSEVWFSRDTRLNARDGSDRQSPDVREFTVKAADSATIGQIFRLPADMRSGQTLYVFVRAIPHDTNTGASLWNSDIAPWNNALMQPNAITVDPGVCR